MRIYILKIELRKLSSLRCNILHSKCMVEDVERSRRHVIPELHFMAEKASLNNHTVTYTSYSE